jgi:hypothetical protein
MAGSEIDPKNLSAAEKINYLITQVAGLADMGTRLSGQMETMTQRMNSHDSRMAHLEKKSEDGDMSPPQRQWQQAGGRADVDTGWRGPDTGHTDQGTPGARDGWRGGSDCEQRDAPGDGDDHRKGYDDRNDWHVAPGGHDGDFNDHLNNDFYGRPRGGHEDQDGYDSGFHHQDMHE